jgi:hypothetical protein
MSLSKGNELLQELHERLTGHWHNEGKYKGQTFTGNDVKGFLIKIIKEYDDDTYIERNNTTNNQE